MRPPIVFLASLLVFSHAFAADNLIRLSKPLVLELPSKDAASKPAAAADGKEVVKTDTSASASASAAGKGDAAPAAKETAASKEAAAMNKEEKAQQELGAKIKAKLAVLRSKNGVNPPPPVAPIPYYRHGRHAKAKAKEKIAEVHEQIESNHWTYDGDEGPTHWGKLNSAWAQCDKGQRQSPIDIHEGIRVNLEAVKFDYKPTHFKVIDNGHTIQVDLEPGNRITLTGNTYELVQFHFHRPAEERINGKTHPMVVHLVHKSDDGKFAVVALLIDEGVANGVMQSVLNNLPLEKNDPVAPESLIDVSRLLPMLSDYYTYMGSLTTPPCSEGVLWIVMKQPIRLSAEQIGIFARLYPMNARPIQSNAGRIIKESN